MLYWSRGIPLGCHAGVVVGKVLGGDCSVLIPEIFEELDRIAAEKNRDWVIESGEILFRALICNHQDKDELKFTEGSVFFTRDVVSIDAFDVLSSSEFICIR